MGKDGFFSRLFVGLLCILICFVLVYAVAVTIKVRQCKIEFINPMTIEIDTREPGEYAIVPGGFMFKYEDGWVFTNWPYAIYYEYNNGGETNENETILPFLPWN